MVKSGQNYIYNYLPYNTIRYNIIGSDKNEDNSGSRTREGRQNNQIYKGSAQRTNIRLERVRRERRIGDSIRTEKEGNNMIGNSWKTEKICIFCGKAFQPRNKKQKYCSYECLEKKRQKEYQLKHSKILRKVCLFCTKEFETTTCNQKFCTPACCQAYRNNPENKPETDPNHWKESRNFLYKKGHKIKPHNENEILFLFGKYHRELGFSIVKEINTNGKSPDCVAITAEEKEVRIEFEFVSSNFLLHNHKKENCDLIICYIHNWKECPVKVLELKNLSISEKEREK